MMESIWPAVAFVTMITLVQMACVICIVSKLQTDMTDEEICRILMQHNLYNGWII
jgi:hypothetical protein